MDFYAFKKLVANYFMPFPLCYLLLVVGLVLLWLGKRQWGKGVLWFDLVLFLLFTTPFLPNALLHKLEHKYPQFDIGTQVDTIVVLGCAHVKDGTLPITSQLYPCSSLRAVEALRLYRLNPQSTIFTSGSPHGSAFSNAEMTKQLLVELGVPENKIRTFNQARDTREESMQLALALQGKTFALVTSASHMQRAMTLFKMRGLRPIAAPTDYQIRSGNPISWNDIPPDMHNMENLHIWWYETLGLLWIWLSN